MYSTQNSYRVDTFDIMKGIASMLMVLGHSLPESESTRYIIYFIHSFNMPLFFIIGGYFFKKKPFIEQLKKDGRVLLSPYIFVCACLIICAMFKDFFEGKIIPHEAFTWFRSGFYGSPPVSGRSNWCGAIWFLFCLFWTRTIFSCFHSDNLKKNIAWFVMIPTLVAYLFNFVYVPLFVLQGIIGLVFFYAGHLIKEYDLLNKKYSLSTLFVMFMVWAYCFLFSPISMMEGAYDNFIMNVPGAISGFYFIYLLSKFIEKKLVVTKTVFTFFGKLSLVTMCIHSIDLSMGFSVAITEKIQALTSLSSFSPVYLILSRYLFVFLGMTFVLRTPIMRRLFSISNKTLNWLMRYRLYPAQ